MLGCKLTQKAFVYVREELNMGSLALQFDTSLTLTEETGSVSPHLLPQRQRGSE